MEFAGNLLRNLPGFAAQIAGENLHLPRGIWF